MMGAAQEIRKRPAPQNRFCSAKSPPGIAGAAIRPGGVWFLSVASALCYGKTNESAISSVPGVLSSQA